MINKPLKLLAFCLFTTLTPYSALAADEAAAADIVPAGARAVAVELEATVTKVNPATREVSLKGAGGDEVTIVAPESVARLDQIKVGDVLVVDYLAALAGEVRAPTDEEKAEPWVETTGAGVSEDGEAPAAGGARKIRAVCTIEGMNRILETVTVKDSRGSVHVIGDVDPAKMEGVTLGQTIVIEFTQALALSVEPAGEAKSK